MRCGQGFSLIAPLGNHLSHLSRHFFRNGLQCQLQNFVHVLHEVEGEGIADVFGDFGQVFAVLGGQDDFMDARFFCRQHFLFDTADRQDPTCQGDFARHRQVRADRASRRQTCQRRCHRDACRWSVFRDGSRWHMDVEVVLGEEVFGDAQLLGAGTHITEGGLG